MPCELVAQGPMWPQTLLSPVFPGLLGISGAPVNGISCQSVAGTKGYETTKDQIQGTVGPAARQAATMKAWQADTPSTSYCVPKTSHLSATRPSLSSLCLRKSEIQSSLVLGVKDQLTTWSDLGKDRHTRRAGWAFPLPPKNLLKLKQTLNLDGTKAPLFPRHRLFAFDIFFCFLSNPLLLTPVLSPQYLSIKLSLNPTTPLKSLIDFENETLRGRGMKWLYKSFRYKISLLEMEYHVQIQDLWKHIFSYW